MRNRALALGLVAGLSVAARAWADDQAVTDAKQLAGLFVQTCVQFAGDAKALRGWAQKTRFAPLPPDGQSAFLNGLPGIAYDATNTHGKFVLISEDGGSCSAVAEHADGAALIAALEETLHEQKVVFQVTSQHPDREEAAMEHREYAATRDGRALAMLVSTTPGDGGGEAMLSLTSP